MSASSATWTADGANTDAQGGFGIPERAFRSWKSGVGFEYVMLSPRDANATDARHLPGYQDSTFEPAHPLVHVLRGSRRHPADGTRRPGTEQVLHLRVLHGQATRLDWADAKRLEGSDDGGRHRLAELAAAAHERP